ncbi:hypothetical protein V5F77_02730 [Xanthobacter sp. DSM 24535]|uniref:hypothetical protein n=1 Tax=Roseixanthobacter psychrophilus TaxID=3119917 RepID=UPI003729F2C8
MLECFGIEICADKVERNHRFLEEALELVQACGCTESEAQQLVRYVYGRPVGELAQEVGGVMVTLAALCLAHGTDMDVAGEKELARVWTKVEQIRAKQAAKPKNSPLPQEAAPAAQGEVISAQSVREAMDSKGFWRSCCGCHELNEGYATGRYSPALRCHLGLGCFECGGIGAVWDTTDYEDMAAFMAAEPATDPTGIDAVQLVREHFARTQEAMGFHESARILRAGSNSPIEQGIGFGRVLIGVRAALAHLDIADLSKLGSK